MSESLDEKILAAYQELKTRDKIDRHLEHLNESFLQLEKRIQILEQNLLEVGKQLERRQKKSDSPVYQLFQSLFQPEQEMESAIEQENHQYYLKVMELKDMRKQQDLLLFEKKVLLEKKVKLSSLDQELKTMLRKKEYDFSNWSREDKYRDDLAKEQEHIIFQRLLIKEMDEAMQAAYSCRNTLNDVIKDLAEVQDTEQFIMSGQGRYLSQGKKVFANRLKLSCDLLGRQLRDLNIQLKDISLSLQIDYQEEYQYFERFTEQFYEILLSSSGAQLRLKKLSSFLHRLRDDMSKIFDQMVKDIERSKRSIKRSERKKELLILLDIKNRKT
jgi:hypothetical protein